MRRSTGILCVLCALVLAAGASLAGAEEARLLRYPSIHRDFVVFVYGGDIWRASADGGRAWRLTSHEGEELTPKISPDGQWIAYSAEYSGTRQVYVMPANGGRPKQLTFYNDVGGMPPRGGFDYWVQGWRPDGKILVRMNRTPWSPRYGLYYLVDPAGGLETPLPIPVAGSGGYSPDGNQLAYTYYDREFRTWKRYQGGRNQDIWIYDLEADQSIHVIDWPSSDNFPMWTGDSIYFTSDREHTLNLWRHDLGSGQTTQVTDFNEFDVLWPSLGPGSIVFMNGSWLYRYDLASGQTNKISISIESDLPATMPLWDDVSDNVAAVDLSPDGKRAVLEARGDLFTVPAKKGAIRRLTSTQGVRESAPAWSADGRSIAYYSDVSGEMGLYVRSQDGTGEPRQVLAGAATWRFPAVWSPDGKQLAFADTDRNLNVVAVDSGAVTLVDTGTHAYIQTYRWSPDSRWLAYEMTHPESEMPAIGIYSLEADSRFVLGDGLNNDFQPTFSANGKFLLFLSNRDFNPNFSAFEFNFIYDNATRIYAAALDPAVEALFPLEADEVAVEDGDGADENGDEGEEKSDDKKVPSVDVVADGIVDRTIALPGIDAGDYNNLTAVEGAVLYTKASNGGPPHLLRYDFESREEKEIAKGVQQYVVAAKGAKVLYQEGGSWKIAAAKPGENGSALDLSNLRMKIDPKLEWEQMYEEAWRIGRDWFYDENMHGVDWRAMGDRYGALVPFIAHRSDLDFLLGELVSELEAGHAYVQRGEQASVERIEGGMLGAELEADESGSYRVSKIFEGENWHESFRSPLTEPGADVATGDFLLAIDGVELTTEMNPYEQLEGKAGHQVTLTVNGEPSMSGARTTTVKTITSERNLRYLDWVSSRAALVEELSGGQVGYIHLPNTATEGNRALQRLFNSQMRKPALIIDDRYNGGGFIPDRMIEMLSRTSLSYWSRRGTEPMRTPGAAHDGPKAMLINGYAASGGDALPYYFRKQDLGPLIGTTTWGGLIGIAGNPMLVDGGGVLYPRFRFFDTEGNYVVEGIGVPPDVEVWDLPEAIAAGGDPSIEKAVEVLLAELAGYEGEPEQPTPPDMSGD